VWSKKHLRSRWHFRCEHNNMRNDWVWLSIQSLTCQGIFSKEWEHVSVHRIYSIQNILCSHLTGIHMPYDWNMVSMEGFVEIPKFSLELRYALACMNVKSKCHENHQVLLICCDSITEAKKCGFCLGIIPPIVHVDIRRESVSEWHLKS
jgi:hypothetical protein